MRRKKKPIPLSTRNREFFQGFYEEHKQLLLYVVSRYTREPQQQEDLIQDALVRLMKNTEILQQLSRSQTAKYIDLTVKAVYLDMEKRRCKEKLVQLDEEALDALLRRSEIHAACETVDALRTDMIARDWAALEGKYIMGYSNEELSVHFGISTDSMRSLLSRARKRARKILSENDREGDV